MNIDEDGNPLRSPPIVSRVYRRRPVPSENADDHLRSSIDTTSSSQQMTSQTEPSFNCSPMWRRRPQKTYSSSRPTTRPKTSEDLFTDLEHAFKMKKILKETDQANVGPHQNSDDQDNHEQCNATRLPKKQKSVSFNNSASCERSSLSQSFPKPVVRDPEPPKIGRPVGSRNFLRLSANNKNIDDESDFIHNGECPDLEPFRNTKLDFVFSDNKQWWHRSTHDPMSSIFKDMPNIREDDASEIPTSPELTSGFSAAIYDSEMRNVAQQQQMSTPVERDLELIARRRSSSGSLLQAGQSTITSEKSSSTRAVFRRKETSTPDQQNSINQESQPLFQVNQSSITPGTTSMRGHTMPSIVHFSDRSSLLEDNQTIINRTGQTIRLSPSKSIKESISSTIVEVKKDQRSIEMIRESVRKSTVSCRTIASRSKFLCEEVVKDVSTVDKEEISYFTSIDGDTLKKKFFDICDQSSPQKFNRFFSENVLNTCKKIGEGSFGEVFTMTEGNRTMAVKIVPIEGKVKYNGSEQLHYRDLLCEATVAKKLSDLRLVVENSCSTFMKIYKIHCVKGEYPEQMKFEWDKFNKKRGSENDNPNIFPDDQLFVTLVGEHCGTSLEDFKDLHPLQAWSVVWQLSISLAVAERESEFEHRDLHTGNVMIKKTSDPEIHFTMNGVCLPVKSHGIRINVIDYSLSRILVDDHVLYVNLANDEDLFSGEGQQYEVYRTMRKDNGNNWKPFKPVTNIRWLSFVCHVLFDRVKRMKHKTHKDLADLRRLQELIGQIDSCSSADEFVGENYYNAMETNEVSDQMWKERRARKKTTNEPYDRLDSLFLLDLI